MSKYSESPITKVRYQIPEILSDKETINHFVEKNANKKVVVVQGLGFVGAVMSIVVANALTEEYAVIGVDIPNENNYWKIQSINEGIFPVIASDPKINLFFENSRKKENFLATYDSYAYSKADVVIVDINLDVQKQSSDINELKGYDVNLSAFKNAIQTIGNNCKDDILLLVETTVPPGTCEKVVAPTMHECFATRNLSHDNIKIAHSYERVMPGPKYIDSIQNFYRVYSGIDEKSADAAEVFLRTVIKTDEYPLTRLGKTSATEMAKVLENSYRAMNIAFMVEWSRFAEEAGVNIYEVVNAIRMRPTHKNIMLPGLGVGGYCLTKDPLLASWAKQNLFESAESLQQSEKGVYINDLMPLYAYQFLQKAFAKQLNNLSVLLLGVSYLNDVGDTRYTPVQTFYEQLVLDNCSVTLHDPHVPFWEEKNIRPIQNLSDVLNSKYDIIVITTGHQVYRNNPEFIQAILAMQPTFIYDTIGVLSNQEISILKQKHTVKVIGRGDL